MTYATHAAGHGRTPLTVVSINFDNKISGNGNERFCDGTIPHGQQFENCLVSVNYSPTKITEAGLGYRCTVSVVLQDFPHPSGVGTYFGRLIGSNPYYIDRRLTIYRGFDHSPFSLSNMKRGDYFIKKIDGPDERGRVKITAADILTMLDSDQALAPPLTYGALASSLSNSYTGNVNVGNNAGYSTNVPILIDDEIITISGLVGNDTITISARGQYGTTAVAHDAGAQVRRIQAHTSYNPVNAIYDYISAHTPISVATYITWSDWEAIKNAYFSGDTINGVIATSPRPVKDIISDICKQYNIAVFWDDEAQKIKLKALGPTLGTNTKINYKDHILNEGHSVTRDQSKALSQVWVYFGKIDLLGSDEAKNYSSVYIYQDSGIEGSTGLGKAAIKKINADYINSNGTSLASKLAYRIAAQLKFGQYETRFRLDVSTAETLNLNCGDPVEITTDLIQGSDGNPLPTLFMITERARRETYVEYAAIYSGIEIGSRYGLVAPNSQANYTSATTVQKQTYTFISSATNNQMSNGDATYKMT